MGGRKEFTSGEFCKANMDRGFGNHWQATTVGHDRKDTRLRR